MKFSDSMADKKKLPKWVEVVNQFLEKIENEKNDKHETKYLSYETNSIYNF